MNNSTKLGISFLILILSLWSFQGIGQINVVPAGPTTFSPEELISNVFLGDGVQVTSITYQGEDKQVGYFNNASSNIGLERGIVLSTGEAEWVVGDANGNMSTPIGSSVEDPDLLAIADDIQPGTTVNDVVIYEISFIPAADTLRFRYIFASEEYPEYVCTNFNDVFGFFISGPGISGAYTNNAENIALIPDPSDPTGMTFTNDPVAINNVNNGNPNDGQCTPAYPMYYNDNSGSTEFSYDGYTDIFTALAIVQPCQEYTIKLAVADLDDEILDTGVFLEAKSFGTGSVLADLQTVSVDGTIVEGCSGAKLKFEISNPLITDLDLNYSIFGNATNVVDYELTKDGNAFTPGDPISITAGETATTLELFAIADQIAETGEYIQISIQKDICNLDTITIPVKDNVLFQPMVGQDTTLCNNNGGAIQLYGDLGIPDPIAPTFTYTGQANDIITNDATPLITSVNSTGIFPQYLQEGMIREVCVKLKHKFDADVDMFLFAPNNAPLLLSSDNGMNSRDMDICFKPDAANSVETINDDLMAIFPPTGEVDFANINNLYFQGDFLPEGVFSDFWDGGTQTPSNGEWRLQIYDDQGSSIGDPATGLLEEWHITFEPVFKINYDWSPSTDLSCLDCPDPILTLPNQTTTYTLTVSDTYGCSVTDDITVYVQDSLSAPIVDCASIGKDFITFSWTEVTGATSYEINIDQGGWVDVGTALSYTLSGLNLDQTVHIEVRAVGYCPAKIGTQSCTTFNCQNPVITTTVNNAACYGDSNGFFVMEVSTPINPPYTFTLDGVTNSTGLFENLPKGTYIVTIKDDIGCEFGSAVFVGEPDSLVVIGFETQKVTCFGGQDGIGKLDIQGGFVPYIINWHGQQDSILGGLAAGDYPFTVTDSHGCRAEDTVTITENTDITFDTNQTDIDCYNDKNGVAEITNIDGGVGTYSFLWDDPASQNTASASQLDIGTYSVTLTDQVGCTKTASFELTQPDELVISVATTPAVCGSSPGSAELTVTGGTGDYTYNWQDIGIAGPIRDDLVGGLYFVTVSDENSCEKKVTVDISAPSDMVLTTSAKNVDCYGNSSGEASVSVVGGTPPYTYQWDDGGLQTDKTAINLPAGKYKVAVTDFKNCVSSDSTEVIEPEKLLIDTVVQHIGCFGASTGQINITVTGGTEPYSYEWTHPDLSITNNANLADIPAGTYTLVVRDDNGCMANLTIQVNQPLPVQISFANSDTICYGTATGHSLADISGGTAPYSFLWNTGETTAQINQLVGGVQYSVTVTDAQSCSYEATTTIPSFGEIIPTIDPTPALCFEGNSGTAQVTSISQNGQSRPLSGFSFQWNTTPAQSSASANQLTGGNTYQVIIEESTHGCKDTASVTIGHPDELKGKLVSKQGVTCFGDRDGSAEVVGEGGTPSYQYKWDNAAGGHQTASITDLSEGTYQVIIRDNHQCETEFSVKIGEPPVIEFDFDTQDVDCAGEATGQLIASISGGEAPYQYLWSQGSTTPAISGLTADQYALTITDNRGCVRTASEEITEPGAPVSGTVETTDILCHGGQDGRIDIFPLGGTAPYTYGINYSEYTGSSVKFGLTAGSHTITIQDSRGCKDTLTDIQLHQPNPILVDIGPAEQIAFGDSIQLVADIQDGIGTLSYEWASGGQTEIDCYDCPIAYAKPEHQEYFFLYVTDENGCHGDAQKLVLVSKSTKIFVPTGFSPNGDGLHEVLFVMGEKDVTIAYFEIFDRWGDLVYQANEFEINDEEKGWDGTHRGLPMPTGQFAWQIKAIMPDGRIEYLQGWSTLIR